MILDPTPLDDLAAAVAAPAGHLTEAADGLAAALRSDAATAWRGTGGDAHRDAATALLAAVTVLRNDCLLCAGLARAAAEHVRADAGRMRHLESWVLSTLPLSPERALERFGSWAPETRPVTLAGPAGPLTAYLPLPGSDAWDDVAAWSRRAGLLP